MVETNPIYVPLLKWKAGEQRALRDVSIDTKNAVLPLIEITPIAWDFDNDCLAKTIDEHLSRFGISLSSSWGLDAPVMLDLDLLDNIPMSSGEHALTWCLRDAHNNNCSVIPVTGFNRDHAYQAAIRTAIQTYGNGVGVRIQRSNFREIATNLTNLLSLIHADPATVDLIIDCEGIKEEDIDTFEAAVETVISRIADVNQYRRIILCATSFPATLAEIPQNTIGTISRAEWVLWNRLNEAVHLPQIIFGDYTIDDPDLPDQIDPRILMKMVVGNIRYTHENEWYISRGSKISQPPGYAQYPILADRLVNHNPPAIFCGATYSTGDNTIYQCARRTGTSGNLTTWVQAGVNHHITFVVDQLSTLIGS